MANRAHGKRPLGKCQSKPPGVRYPLTPARVALIRETNNTKCWWDVEKSDPSVLLVGMQNSAVILEKRLAVSKKGAQRFTIRTSNCTPKVHAQDTS